MAQQTLVVLKPDAVQRRLIGRLVSRFEDRGLRVAGLRLVQVDEPLARRMYSVHEGKEFYEPLVTFLTSGPIVAMVVAGREAIAVVRDMIGPTFGPDAPAGTIRGDFGLSRRYNLVHASDSPESAAREIPLFFEPDQIAQYPMADDDWVYADNERQ